jgi:hypothetical protein
MIRVSSAPPPSPCVASVPLLGASSPRRDAAASISAAAATDDRHEAAARDAEFDVIEHGARTEPLADARQRHRIVP